MSSNSGSSKSDSSSAADSNSAESISAGSKSGAAHDRPVDEAAVAATGAHEPDFREHDARATSGQEPDTKEASASGKSADATHHISRVLPSSLSVYHDFVQDILEKLQALGWEEKLLFGIHMALEESISNAIRHGNKEEPEKKVHVDCQLSATRFWVKVCDEGDGYEPDAVPDCRCPENLEVPGGRGLALIRHYMTSVEHTDCGACVVMEKLREAA